MKGCIALRRQREGFALQTAYCCMRLAYRVNWREMEMLGGMSTVCTLTTMLERSDCGGMLTVCEVRSWNMYVKCRI